MDIINSSQNKFVKEIASILKKSDESYVVEGKKFVLDVMRTKDIEYYALSESFYEQNRDISIDFGKVKIFTDSIFKKFSDTVSNQGILCVIKKPETGAEEGFELATSNVMLIIDGVQDPGNLGTIIRTFRATGGNLILTTKNTVTAYNPKCIRSTAGVIEKVNIIEKLENSEIYDYTKRYGYTIIGTHLQGDKSIYELDLTQKIAFVVGNEGVGMSEYFTEKSDILTKIPIDDDVESLNAAVATSVVLYEALRQNFNG